MRNHFLIAMAAALAVSCGWMPSALADDTLPPINERYADAGVTESPDFQKHVVPLFGRLGCNGRACHGSFQGRGGFRLSLFGYDFKSDHAALFDEKSPRVDTAHPLESLIIVKPTDEDMHEGGERYAKDSWQYHVIRRWIESGAKFEESQVQKLMALEIVPSELQFHASGEQVQVKAFAVWEDGSREDVSPLCRFQTNDEMIAKIDDKGMVTSNEKGDTHLVISYDKAVVTVPVIRPVSDLIADKYPEVATPTKVDELVVQKLRKLGIVPSEICTDAEFLRRVRLDLTGTLPTADEVESFLSNTDPDKRAKKVDELLETPAYAAWWTTKLCDFTGSNDEQLNNVTYNRNQASQDWYDWIYRRVKENAPYDELAEGIIVSNAVRPGQSYLEYCKEMSEIARSDERDYSEMPDMMYYWSRRDFQNNMEARAIGFAYSFMGIRIQCAQCHKHPFDQWSRDDFHQFKNFFARISPANRNAAGSYRKEYNKLIEELGVKEKRNNDLQRELPRMLQEGKTIPFPVSSITSSLQSNRNPDDEYPVFDQGKLLGGEVVDVLKAEDPRTILMDWLRSPDNIYFARSFVNRAWASYFNVGIVNPPDDLNLANPPSNKALLDHLAQGFIESKFDMRWVHRTIINSATYQRSWQANDTNRLDERNFSRSVPRRLPAEVAYDAMQQATASDERAAEFSHNIKGRAIGLAQAGARYNNGNSDQSFALTVFGRSTRESNCDCDRSAEPSLLQTVFLQNDRSMLTMLEGSRGSWLDQVDRELNAKAIQAENNDRIADLEKQIDAGEARLGKAEKQKNEKAIRQAEQRLTQLENELADLKKEAAKVQAEKPADEQVSGCVIDAYLRTVSRYPTQDELARSLQYVQESDEALDGVRDVLWALINTKEFIVNH